MEYIWTSVPRRAEVSTRIGRHGVVLDGADEVFAPLLDRTRSLHRPSRDAAAGRGRGRRRLPTPTLKKMWRLSLAHCGRPSSASLLGDPMRLLQRRVRGRGCPRHIGQIDGIDLDVFVFLLAAVDGVAYEGQFVAVGRGNQIIRRATATSQSRGCRE